LERSKPLSLLYPLAEAFLSAAFFSNYFGTHNTHKVTDSVSRSNLKGQGHRGLDMVDLYGNRYIVRSYW